MRYVRQLSRMLHLLIPFFAGRIRQHNIRMERIFWLRRRLYAAIRLGCSASNDYGPSVKRPVSASSGRCFLSSAKRLHAGCDAQAVN